MSRTPGHQRGTVKAICVSGGEVRCTVRNRPAIRSGQSRNRIKELSHQAMFSVSLLCVCLYLRFSLYLFL